MLPRFISGVPKFLQAPTISRKGAGPDLYCDVGQLLAKNPVQNETTAAGKRRSWLDTNARAAGQKSEHQATRHDSQLYSADTRETHTQKKKRKTTAGQLQLLRHQTFSQANTTETFSRNLTPATRPPRSHTRTRSVTLPATHSPHVLAWLPPLLHTSVHSPLKPSLLSHTHSHTNTVSVTKVYASCSSEAAAVPGCQRHKREKHCTAFHVVRLRNVMDLASDSLGMT